MHIKLIVVAIYLYMGFAYSHHQHATGKSQIVVAITFLLWPIFFLYDIGEIGYTVFQYFKQRQ